MRRPRPRSFSGLRLARLWCADPFGQGLVESGGAAVEIDPGDVTVGSDQNRVWVGYLAQPTLRICAPSLGNGDGMSTLTVWLVALSGPVRNGVRYFPRVASSGCGSRIRPTLCTRRAVSLETRSDVVDVDD
jgi:hypothetical protein